MRYCGAVVKELLARANKPGSTPVDAFFCFSVSFFFFLFGLFCYHYFAFWPFYFGGARRKGFATLRNVSKLTFLTRLGTQSL